MQKLLFLFLLVVIQTFQYQLWWGKGGIEDSNKLRQQIKQQYNNNINLRERNENIVYHLQELKGSAELMEARARMELNLIKANETLVILPPNLESPNKLATNRAPWSFFKGTK
jgi:cell division protein FtsB